MGYSSARCIKIGYSSGHCIKIGYSSDQCIKIGYSSGQCIKIGNVPKYYRGSGCSLRGWGSFANVGFTTGLILPYLERLFVGLHILLLVRIIFKACGSFIRRADTDMT